MWYFARGRVLILCVASLWPMAASQKAIAQQHPTFLGMDRNDYPGDANMQVLRKSSRSLDTG